MTKYCGNCGAQMDDDALVCGQCGTPIDGAVGLKIKKDNTELKAKITKIVKTVIVVAVLAGAVFGGWKAVYTFTGTRGFVRKVMAEFKDYDIDGLVNISSDLYLYDEDDLWASNLEQFVGSYIDTAENNVGHNYKIKYEINETYTVSERKKSELIKILENELPNYNAASIESIEVADVDIIAEQGNKILKREVNIWIAVENGERKLLYFEYK